MIVPMPSPSAIVALTVLERFDGERLVDLVERVARRPCTVTSCVVVRPGRR